eukprot:TRINITY_DN30470_c0_g1_i2.p2 TRINITY_DN30470_c0_g1~~TRINITY_DN30470_c0_g1_i2.p2  ORF type:complete len:161 (+),score=24.75 TRINITY_DN30470_c0_g1_i2:56-538(+)
MSKRWVRFENLGTRMNWQSLKRKALEALGQSTDAAIKGGRMDRASRSAILEFEAEDEAAKVAKAFDGYHDKVTCANSDQRWSVRVVTEDEAGNAGASTPAKDASSVPLNDRFASSPSPARPARRSTSRPRRAGSEERWRRDGRARGSAIRRSLRGRARSS